MTDVDGDGPGAQERPEAEHGGRGVSQGSQAEPGEPEHDGRDGHDERDERVDEQAEEQPGQDEAAPEPDGAPGDEIRALRRSRRARRMRRVKIGLLVVTTVTSLGVATAFGFAAWDVQHLTHNLKHTALLPSGFTEPPEIVDAFGRSPINILLIGSDTRDTAADCGLGGACVQGQANNGANGDSEMIVHLSADRSNVTVLSIPRDTETDLPSCAGGGRGMINSALAFGASCQVAAVVKLTGIPIDHFMDFDFSGVVDLSGEIGGVPVCVSAAVHDPYSGLTIGAGTTNVQGRQALQFLRTREAFYDGSDLGREQATHIFMSSLLRKAKQDATLTNLGQLQSIAETLTKYTTVDDGLDSALGLIDLGQDFGKVDSNRVTFLTMPWQQDTDTSDPSYQNRVEPSSEAAAIFAAVKQDKSFTTSSAPGETPDPLSVQTGGPSMSPPANPSTNPSGGASGGTTPDAGVLASQSAAAHASQVAAAIKHPMHVNVVNASGTTLRYETVVPEVFQDGFVYTSGSDATATTPVTTLVYAPQEAAAAAELAADLNLPSSSMQDNGTGTTLVLTIGTDWTSGSTYQAAGSTSSPSAAFSVPSDSYVENGANATACVQANPSFETHSN